MNIIILSRIIEITEKKPMFFKIRQMVSNWKALVIYSALFLTCKVAAEQLAMMVIRGNN